MPRSDRFARIVFAVAGIYGVLVLVPQYFLLDRISRDFPPPITHPEQYYGFIGVALAWQVVFLIIARDVRRYRPLMLPSILEKLAFGVPALILHAAGRVATAVAAVGALDLVLGALFAAAWVSTRDADGSRVTAMRSPP